MGFTETAKRVRDQFADRPPCTPATYREGMIVIQVDGDMAGIMGKVLYTMTLQGGSGSGMTLWGIDTGPVKGRAQPQDLREISQAEYEIEHALRVAQRNQIVAEHLAQLAAQPQPSMPPLPEHGWLCNECGTTWDTRKAECPGCGETEMIVHA